MARPPRSRSRPRRLPQTLHNGFQTYKEKLRWGGAKLSPGVLRKRRNAAFSSFWGDCFSVCARMARSATRNPPEGFRFDARAVRAGWKKGRGQATANGLGAGNRPFLMKTGKKTQQTKTQRLEKVGAFRRMSRACGDSCARRGRALRRSACADTNSRTPQRALFRRERIAALRHFTRIVRDFLHLC